MRRLSTAALALGFALSSAAARAQTIGVRAQGMGGAFTGVADDASAVYWNPAGLASGAYFSGVVDFNSLNSPSGVAFGHDSSGALVSIAMPALGLSYYRTRSLVRSTPAFPAAAGSGSHAANVTVGSLVTNQFGATLVQSLSEGLAVGATLKLVHGTASTGVSTNTFDADVGLMETGSVGHLGIAVHNLLRPAFAASPVTAAVFRLDRRVRIGGSLNLTDSTLLAADADLTTTSATGAERRDAAVGIEERLSATAVVRGGVHWNTRLRSSSASTGAVNLGPAPEGSFGASYAVYGRTSVDAQVTFGSKNGDRGWGVGLRMVF